ncbi:hypothetical protein HHI36_005309 [Cryptolaemus montrouzieri]|uniref:Uncharacterized protein n=1 Tax=Cryptolaemus montrouzieri TaxID=559131 RepID=A0ABD2NTQ9_9CUCU
MNVKSSFKDVIHRNTLEAYFTEESDERLKYLKDFGEWLCRWKSLNLQHGFLTLDTFNALYQNTIVTIDLIKYSLSELKMSYVLPGKLQTDNLEGTFSRYRQLLVESKSNSGLNSARYGPITFSVGNLAEAGQSAKKICLMNQMK